MDQQAESQEEMLAAAEDDVEDPLVSDQPESPMLAEHQTQSLERAELVTRRRNLLPQRIWISLWTII